jgi:hypothetical protein
MEQALRQEVMEQMVIHICVVSVEEVVEPNLIVMVTGLKVVMEVLVEVVEVAVVRVLVRVLVGREVQVVEEKLEYILGKSKI